MMRTILWGGFMTGVLVTAGLASPTPGKHGHYAALTCKSGTPAPFAAVDLVYGPIEQVGGASFVWWQLEVHGGGEGAAEPLLQLQALTSHDPLSAPTQALTFQRYVLTIPETGETLEYRNVRSGRALLPGWGGFEQRFIPRRAAGSGEQEGLARTADFLGHVLTLQHVGSGVAWKPLENVRVLELDPELLIGTSRNFKDKEGHRLPQKPERQNYTYVPFTGEDYAEMIRTGVNLFTISPDQEQYVRGEPVFYLRGAQGKPPLRYPADLYRGNYIGHDMFMDEPSIIMVGDKLIHRTLKYFSDAAAVIVQRVDAEYRGAQGAVYSLERALISNKVNLGGMRLEVLDIPTWETLYETAFYQMKAGGSGIVHEGRYQLDDFEKAVTQKTGLERRYTPEEMLRYYYATLRGGTRPFGKHWGTAIYGQCDPKIAPLALTLAYDMGARYLWFWTSDHDHHMPWPEQMELTRQLRRHAAAHPRGSIFGPPRPRDLAIVVPYGYFLSLENLWWVRELDPEGKNEASQRYRRLMTRAFQAIHEALDAKQDFDITIDDPDLGAEAMKGYKKVVRISDEP